jgi:hypothetical protein
MREMEHLVKEDLTEETKENLPLALGSLKCLKLWLDHTRQYLNENIF